MNLHSIINQPKRTLKQLVHVTDRLIRDQKDISGFPGIYWQLLMWQRSTLLDNKAVQFTTAKNLLLLRFSIVYGRTQFKSRQSMKEKIDWFVNSRQNRELDRIDGEPMKFEWKTFPGFTTVQILADSKYDE